MADTLALTQDPRRRNLVVLAVIAAVMVVLAALALIHQSRQVAPHYTPHTFLQGLASEVRDVAPESATVSPRGIRSAPPG